MNNQKTLETEILKMSKRLEEIEDRHKIFQSEREEWLKKPDSPEKQLNLNELAGNLRIAHDDAGILQNILRDLKAEKTQIDNESERQQLEKNIEVMEDLREKIYAERDARIKIVRKAQKIISNAEAEHKIVLDSLFDLNIQYRRVQQDFLVHKFGSASAIPKNWDNELKADLISNPKLGWLK